jgi:hypothetical protein
MNMNPALYILGDVLAVRAFLGLCTLVGQVFIEIFGIYGIAVAIALMFGALGGWLGWMIYRHRRR